MKYYTFQPQFHDAILSGTKCSTIRQKPKVSFGERFSLRTWTGAPYRSKQRELAQAVCTAVAPIYIGRWDGFDGVIFAIDYRRRLPDWLATIEGFTSGESMLDWFVRTYHVDTRPFRGTWTRWSLA